MSFHRKGLEKSQGSRVPLHVDTPDLYVIIVSLLPHLAWEGEGLLLTINVAF